jgi:hypothetical protein
MMPLQSLQSLALQSLQSLQHASVIEELTFLIIRPESQSVRTSLRKDCKQNRGWRPQNGGFPSRVSNRLTFWIHGLKMGFHL